MKISSLLQKIVLAVVLPACTLNANVKQNSNEPTVNQNRLFEATSVTFNRVELAFIRETSDGARSLKHLIGGPEIERLVVEGRCLVGVGMNGRRYLLIWPEGSFAVPDSSGGTLAIFAHDKKMIATTESKISLKTGSHFSLANPQLAAIVPGACSQSIEDDATFVIF